MNKNERYAKVMNKLLKKMFLEIEENAEYRSRSAESEASARFILEEEQEDWYYKATHLANGAIAELYDWMLTEMYGNNLDEKNMFKEFEDVRH